ncbi:phage tail tape measure protein [Halomonas sp. M20]|uniref:phage tail tape measure protein n=1 Tax=Halomonas sp. M20 TaxID=2763264 RepID=UPI001D0B006A|nr:phage tail tape measure protein [Halomonas sp. M20]
MARDLKLQVILDAVDRVTGPLKNITRGSGKTAEALKASREELKRLNQQQRDAKTRMDQAGGATDRYADEQRALAARIKDVNAHIKTQQERLSKLAQKQKAARDASRRYSRDLNRAQAMAGTGAAGLATGGAALYGGARLLAPGVDYGAAMSRVQALTRLDKDDPRLQALMDQARELGSTTSFSATEAAGAQGFLGMAGFDPEAILAAMPDMLALAKASNAELGRTADIASNLLSGFGLAPQEMGRLADVITATTTRANVDLEMLGESMKYVAPQARAMGLSLEEAAAMAGLLGNVGIQGSQAGTTLRAMMTRLAAPTGKAAGALEALGVNGKDAEGNLRNVPKILADVARATERMGNADRAEYLKNIFGEEPGAGMAELIAQQGAAGVEQFVEILTNAAGENARVAKVMADNIQGDLLGLNSAWQEIGITITDTNQGPLRELIQNVTEITRGVGNWMKENPELAGTLATVAAGLATTVAVGGGLLVLLGSILGPIAAVRYALTLLSLNPVSLTIMGIVAAVTLLAAGAYYVYKHWDGISSWFGERWQQVKDAFNDGIGAVGKLLLNWSPLGLLYKGITAALEALGVEIPDKFKNLGNAIIDGLIGGIGDKFGELKNKITGIAGNVSGWFKDTLGIKSPSRVFMSHGADTLAGYQKGLAANEGAPLKQIGAFGKRMKQAGAGLAIGAASLPAVADIPLDTRAPMSAASGGNVTFTFGDINVHPSPGMDEQALARYVGIEVQRALAQAERDAGVRRRSALYDTD